MYPLVKRQLGLRGERWEYTGVIVLCNCIPRRASKIVYRELERGKGKREGNYVLLHVSHTGAINMYRATWYGFYLPQYYPNITIDFLDVFEVGICIHA